MTFDIKNKPIFYSDGIFKIIRGNGEIRKRGWRYYAVMKTGVTKTKLIICLKKALWRLENDQ